MHPISMILGNKIQMNIRIIASIPDTTLDPLLSTLTEHKGALQKKFWKQSASGSAYGSVGSTVYSRKSPVNMAVECWCAVPSKFVS